MIDDHLEVATTTTTPSKQAAAASPHRDEPRKFYLVPPLSSSTTTTTTTTATTISRDEMASSSAPPDDAPRASFSHASRFLEGSMNDRVSAAPPPVFLGPEDAAAYERQFYVEKRASVQSDNATALSSKKSSSSSSAGGFFAPLLERLHITRSKTSGTGTGDKTGSASDFKTVEYKDARKDLPLPTQRSDGGRPTREDMQASYQDLMKSGFFNAHAIQSTRHAPPRPPTAPLRSQPAAFTPMPTIYSVPSEQPPAATTTMLPAALSNSHLLPRGTKRPLDPETPARRLVKKLRKSTSRLGGGGGAADRHLPSSSSTASSLFAKHHQVAPSQPHALDRRLSKSPRRRHPPSPARRHHRHRRTPSPNKLERAAAAARAIPVVLPPPPSSPGKRERTAAPAVPSFHYPQRTRHPRAAPDDVNPLALHPLRLSPARANRAAPPNPPVPEPFKFGGATAAVVGVREEDVENHQAPLARAWKGIQWR